jgi:hypothetical protein
MSFIGLAGRPGDRLIHDDPAVLLTHTCPPPNAPPKAAHTCDEVAGSTAIPRQAIGDGSGGVRLCQPAPALVENITLTGWLPSASSIPIPLGV